MVVCVASSFSWASLLSPLVVIVSVGVAAIGVRSARETARQRATLDMIEKVESSEHYRRLHSAFTYHRRQNSFSKLHSPNEEKDKIERQCVLDYLNHYEMVSIGVREKILSQKFYKKWMLGAFIRDWNAASDFIQRERWKWDEAAKKWLYHRPLYEHYQWVAVRMSAAAVNLDEDYSSPPARPEGPGDEALPTGRNGAAA